ncbi:6-phospho-beta-glucosidase [Spiroplasma gladiatoris]|uniref:6-phospho-beta-glucosidase n=1 Tax=Spiroplasma gladiatoris TaxID=2143 RepID=A0A4P7AI40_9MOLU|nr:glycoside hydrolase family 1 protein [Spiroplasma gladiatoris]QBQ07831.1 6-phospho-beta-glucosidase [Spiroplasma gladiatoris]
MPKKINDNFLWGASTSAYQFEGGYNADRKGLSVQDVRNNYPEGTTNFEVASDHYNKWKEDVKMMSELGLKSYRFSISWTRILPNGRGDINKKGLEFYNNLINELIKYNITPIVTIYHFDLPDKLDKDGGWHNKNIIEDFLNYSKILFENFGDRVNHWLTINEQNIMILFGEIVGIKIPETENKIKYLYQINHNMMVAQAKVINLCHKTLSNSKIGPAPNIACVYPGTSKPIDNLAAFNMKVMRNWFYLDTCVFGRYNKLVLNYLRENNSMFEYTIEEMNEINSAKPDFIAFNYYTSSTAIFPFSDKLFDEMPSQQKIKSVKGMYQQVKNDNLNKTDFGWEIDAIGFRNTLRELYDRYNLPLLITENGIGGYDKIDNNYQIHDQYRIKYYKEHIKQMKIAILQDNIDIIGYNPWSAFDLVSTHEGVKKRYGFIYVDREDFDLKECKRYKKDSFYWYKNLIENNANEL